MFEDKNLCARQMIVMCDVNLCRQENCVSEKLSEHKLQLIVNGNN